MRHFQCCFFSVGGVVGPDIFVSLPLHWLQIREVSGIMTIVVTIVAFHHVDILFSPSLSHYVAAAGRASDLIVCPLMVKG